jgi:hypothetical protein
MLAAVARVRVATGLPDITFLWQYYAGREIGQDPIRLKKPVVFGGGTMGPDGNSLKIR